ncbi:low temperature requirement protein A [Amycolatopsis nigrescens]|uniref:low temperature requirement protein A n=1 Tax=Amycolatopsis nigrescens TaxID=381445 RepID=UPI000378951E|nr:low temperature requirement protein A [Amycolatopsis nigrescens]
MPQESVRPHHRVRVWYRPMVARGDEEHRAATTLELLFDLCFVVAVGQAAAGLHHAFAENHAVSGVVGFLMVFFAIWWAWLQFSWFATSYDTDDVPYRLAVLVQIAGGLVIAAGVSSAYEKDFTILVIGYVLMRLAGVNQWLRAARADRERRPTALRYAASITFVQLCWIGWLFFPDSLQIPGFLLFLVLELAGPIWAERAAGTTWNRHHIAERYGLFTIIVLGETVIGATAAVREGLDEGHNVGGLISLAAAGLVIVFSLWWLYFDQPAHHRLTSLRSAVTWGYGHYFIFASAAAVGAGMEIAVGFDSHTEHTAPLAAALAITVPVAIYLLSVWLLHIGPGNECRPIAIGFPAAAVLVLASTFSPAPVHFTAVIAAALVATTVIATKGHPVEP